jgi:hypothetical protein
VNIIEEYTRNSLAGIGPFSGPNETIPEVFYQENFLIVLHEIIARISLLAITSVKCLFSPLSYLRYKESPLKNVRFLAAELFELIGVVVFSTLNLPFHRSSSNYIMKGQCFIENYAARISGQATLIDYIREQKALLPELKDVPNLTPEQTIEWYILTNKLDSFLNTRRISRNQNIKDDPIASLRKIEGMLPQNIRGRLITEKEKHLAHLNGLIKKLNLKAIDDEKLDARDPFYFKNISIAINKRLVTIWNLIDVNKSTRDNFFFFKKNLYEALCTDPKLLKDIELLKDSLPKNFNVDLIYQNCKEELNKNFIYILDFINIMEKFYSFYNNSDVEAVFSEKFMFKIKDYDNFSENISVFHNAFKIHNEFYYNAFSRIKSVVSKVTTEKYKTLQKYKELIADLGLTGHPSLKEINRAYKQLLLRHHPDKRGNKENFTKISTSFHALKEMYENYEEKQQYPKQIPGLLLLTDQ